MEGTERTVHLPAPIVERLRRGLAGELADTPKAGDPVFIRSRTIVIGDNRAAAEAACERARTLGCNALLLSTFVEGEAREIAKIAAALGKEVLASGHPLPPPACLVLGGETTVTLRGAGDAGSEPGRGGRNGELALAAALALDGTAGITVASLATDGSDGPTDSAGGLVDGTTAERARRLGYDPADALRRHDSYPLLAAVDDLLVSGPTQTNVNDLIVVLVRSNVEAFSEPRATKGIESCPS